MAQFLLFDAGGYDFATPAESIKSIHEHLDIQAISGTSAWFRGLAVAHGKLLPVTDVGAYIGRRSSTGRILELDHSVGFAGLQVDTVLGLSEKVPEKVALEKDGTIAKIDKKMTLGERAIIQAERIHRIIDIAALVQSTEFLSIAETT